MLETDENGVESTDETPTGVRRISSIAPTGDLIVLCGAVLLCIAFAPVLVSAPYSPRLVLLLGFLPVGVVAFGALCMQRDRAAIAACSFLVVAVISAAISDHPRISLIGQMGKESSALLLAAFFSWWALGRRLSERGRSLLPYALLVGLGVNAFVAILQIAVDNNSSSEFGVATGGRAVGLTANPVQLGALMAAGAAISGTLAVASSHRRWWALVLAAGVFSGAANLSGTRIAMVAIAVVTIALVAIHRSRRVGALAAAVAVGAVLSNFAYSDTSGGGASTSRITASFDRTNAWIYGLKAFVERPLLGYGPGGFRPATQHRFAADFVRTAAFDERRQAWFDAHNVVIEYLVATGIIGLTLLALFAFWSLRRARGPLLAAFVAIAITWTLQPLSVATAPIALLALGAAGPAAAVAVERRRPVARPAFAVAAAVGLVLGLGYAAIDLRLDAAIESGDAVRIEQAARPFWRDAVVADMVAQGWANAYLFDGADRSHLLTWSAKVVEREPDRPYWWSKRGATLLGFGDNEGARDALDHAIALQPWSPSAWPLMLELAKRTDDTELEATARAKVCELQLPACTDP